MLLKGLFWKDERGYMLLKGLFWKDERGYRKKRVYLEKMKDGTGY